MPLYYNPEHDLQVEFLDTQVANGEVPAHYQLIKEDGTVELSDHRKSAQNYLNSTDWYLTRFVETGKAVPELITQARANARFILNS